MVEITIVSTNQQKPNTCGSCEHTNNDLGLVALHCDILMEQEKREKYDCPDGKVRSWWKCQFKPSKYTSRKV